MRGKGPKKLNKFVPEDLSRVLHKGLGQVYRLYPMWEQAAGDKISQHSRPIGYADRCLTIQADSPIWAAAIRQQHRSILAQMKQYDGLEALQDIRVRISPTRIKIGPVQSVNRPAAPMPNSASESIARTADVIEDEKLKAALKRLQETASRHKKH